jgi:hypothetical protein
MNIFNYIKMKTKPINNITQKINKLDLHNIIKKTYNIVCFSTFPYMVDNSNTAISKYNCGDCVAMSIYIMNELEKINIKSYLIPASIPKIYQRPNLLKISHVALVIPINSSSFYIIDPSFYFCEPILVDIKNNSYIKTYKTIDIYNNVNDFIHMNIYKSIKDIIYNEYQTIYKNTYICNCYYDKDHDDRWNYYITNIINPDEAITTHYLNATRKQFICSTISDDNNLCKLGMYLKVHNNYINVIWENEPYYYGTFENIPKDKLYFIKLHLSKYFKNGDIIKYLKKSNRKLYIMD